MKHSLPIPFSYKYLSIQSSTGLVEYGFEKEHVM